MRFPPMRRGSSRGASGLAFTLLPLLLSTGVLLGCHDAKAQQGGFDLKPVWVRVGDSEGAVDQENAIASVESAEFSPDGQFIATGAKHGGDVRLWTIDGEEVWQRFHENDPNDEVEVIAWTKDGQHVLSGGEDFRVRVWRAEDGTQVQALKHAASIDGMRLSHSGDLLATGDENGQISIWDTSAPDPRDWPDEPIAVVDQGYDPEGGARPDHADVNSIDWTRDDRFIVTAGRNGVVKRWEVAAMGEADQGLRQTYRGFDDSIKSVRLSPDDRLIAAGGQKSPDALVLVWDYETGEVVKRIAYPTFPKIEAVEWTPDGRYLLTGGIEGVEFDQNPEGMGDVAEKYDSNNGIGHIRAHDRESDFELAAEEEVYRQEYLHFNADGSRLVSGHEDGTVRLWDVERP